jgi:hypothetical protein
MLIGVGAAAIIKRGTLTREFRVRMDGLLVSDASHLILNTALAGLVYL